ncbi:MAG TPA: FG-GAP-like repeat-containing protein, partial [Pyrinomonadaceae bacterium]|nr:FG-GAP-like repeat-containing protein [Pyrinomonadaceae bacterium]
TAGMTPQLALAYNSGAGNDLLGVGWSLHGLSAITRCAATEAQDGFRGTVAYDEGDRFALDGQRLMAVSGSGYGAEDAVYHTEVESWHRVAPVYGGSAAPASGPVSFVVQDKDGRTYEYGATPDSRVAASADNPSVRVWALNKITDSNGNYLTVTYQPDPSNNTNCPLSIDYTFNEGLTQFRSVKFIYEPRPDPYTRYAGGYPVTTTQLLKQVQTLLDGELVRTYTLEYQQGQATGRSRLCSVTESDAAGAALPPTTFEWQDGDAGLFAACAQLPATGQPWQGTLLSLDANGDGLCDIVNAYQSDEGNLQLTLFLADEEGFSSGIVIETTIPYAEGMQILPMDVDGDGCVDLVCAQSSGDWDLGLTVLLSRPGGEGGWQFVQGALNGGGPPDLPWGGQLLSMDVDGDGMADLVYSYQNGMTLALAFLFSDGSAFAPSPDDKTSPTVDFFGGAQYLGGDFNGDGMCDLVYAYQSGDYMAMTLFLSAGRGGLIQQAGSPLPSATSVPACGALTTLDVNSDGLADLVQAYLDGDSLVVNTLLSNGASFEPAVTQNFQIPNLGTATPTLLPMDVNGDGLPDLVISAQNGDDLQLSALLSNGGGFTLQEGVAQPPASIQPGGVILPFDANGDGKTDLVFAYNAGDAEQSLGLSKMLAAGPFPDLLTGVTNGLGGKFGITYAPLTDASVYSRNAPAGGSQVSVQNLLNNSVSGASYPITYSPTSTPSTPGSTLTTRLVDFPKYVVASHTKDDAVGQSYSYDYYYAAALLDLTGRGWLGFNTMRMTDNDFQTTTVTHYNQQFPLTHSVESSTIGRSADGALMHRVTYEYQQAVNAPNTGPGVALVLTQSVRTDCYNFAPPGDDPAPDTTDLTTYAYDDGFGNATQTSHTGTGWGAPLYVFETYLNDPSKWALGFKTGRALASDAAGEQVLSRQAMAYDPGTLKLTRTELWNDQAQSMEATGYGYDAYGNQTSVTDPSGAVSRIAYDAAYQTFMASKTSPPNQSGRSLTWQYAYYPQFGVRQSETDANGVVRGQNVDGLGRVVETYGPDPSGATVTLSRVTWASDQSGTYRQTDDITDWAGTADWARQYLDGFSRVWRVASLGPDGESTVLVDKTLNSRGLTLRQSLPYYETGAPLFIENTYDNFGRQTQIDHPLGGGDYVTTRIDYETATRVVQTEAFGRPYARATTSEYSTFNSKRVLVNQTDAAGATTAYGYDPLGRLVSVKDGAGVVTSAAYDSLNRKISLKAESPSGTVLSEETFTFDDLNRTTTHVDARQTRIVQTYDALRRLVGRTVQLQGGEPVSTAYTLDDPSSAYGQDRVSGARVQDGVSYAYGYDPDGNQTEITIALDGESYAFKKSYLPGGRLGRLTFPDLSVQTNNYNAARQLTSVAVAAEGGPAPQTLATYSEFYPFGAAGHVAYGNSTSAGYTYDGGARLTAKSLAGPSGPLAELGYGWNDLFELTEVRDELTPANTQTFGYDPVGRLAQA